MNKEQALKEINETQDYYVDQLIKIIIGKDTRFEGLKEIAFTSPTGTGKTVMMSKLINRLPDYFFLVTTLSRGQLKKQIEDSIKRNVKNLGQVNVYGLNDFTKSSKLKEEEIIDQIPHDKPLIWLRDEGHIATNRWQEIIRSKAKIIINYSATNKTDAGIQCNFSHTMMLRTVNQQYGTPSEALDKLEQIKREHSHISKYNPCALFRVLNDELSKTIIKTCNERKLKVINITDEDFDMSDLCEDSNEYDVIINKFKITEGIDLRRCHVIYMDTRPSNEATIVQIIGRARRNALFWRKDVDILQEENKTLLSNTRQCFVFYNVSDSIVAQNEDGELSFSLCDVISVESLKCNIDIEVENGKLPNGLTILELINQTGRFKISMDKEFGFNVVNEPTFYRKKTVDVNPLSINLVPYNYSITRINLKPNVALFYGLKERNEHREYDWYRFRYYCYESFLSKKIPDFDKERWSKGLRIEDKSKEISWAGWQYFLNYYKNEIQNFDFKEYYSKLTLEEKVELFGKSITDNPKNITAKKDIFSGDFYRRVSFSFLPFIKNFEAYDLSIQEYIESKLSSLSVVDEIGKNRYCVRKFPSRNKMAGIYSMEDLKKKVFNNKKTIYGIRKEEWLKALSRYKSLDEIASAEVYYCDLETINEKFNLGLSQEAMDCYLTGNYPIKTFSPKELEKDSFCLMRFDKSLNKFVPAKKGSYLIGPEDFRQSFEPYKKIINDRFIGIVGADTMRYHHKQYVEDTAVTSKISKFSKLNSFVSEHYSSVIDNCRKDFFKKPNELGLDKKCNSCLGFCVEYYAKYLLYGDNMFRRYIDAAKKEAKVSSVSTEIIVRACFLAYKAAMASVYGFGVQTVIPSISIEQLIDKKYQTFIELVVQLGEKVANFVKKSLYDNKKENIKYFDTDLSVNHIAALCDFVNENTIIDLKCTSEINERYIKQILCYYILSQKRSDLHIDRLIVFDAITGKSICISMK